ncbi:glycosyltransferase family 4 protein [Marinilabilia rubra]|uniref:4-alpha-glucanotransferase n=1 Tax=Marinilabilia rubra TaxID=2162893 RepID=A0A2U2BEJ5_9BACT|nr:glycosyltransferase family 4 protein [Marinilabilia rubra]PWE01437.1 4-alpha-glucanotransferase [Marinilabilia rubra]
MKVLMFGWEFPPHISGGLGTACYGLTRGLARIPDIEVLFVVPKAYGDEDKSEMKLIGANEVTVKQRKAFFEKLAERFSYIEVNSRLMPYKTPEDFQKHVLDERKKNGLNLEINEQGTINFSGSYGSDLLQEIRNYALVAGALAEENSFDVIHAHDWLAYPAGIAAKEVSGKPLIIHVHATDFDRSGGSVNPEVFEIEKQGMEAADRIITVSNLTRQTVINKYGIEPQKVNTIYNAVEPVRESPGPKIKKGVNEKIVTFLGRITMQKGPEFFIEAAHRVLQKNQNVRFVMAGNGDMMEKMIRMAARLQITDRFHFTGFLKGQDVFEMLQMSDLYIMPSVSEPFGIVPLEAMQSDVPVLISNQTGAAEILKYAMKTDYWDVDAMADSINALLNYGGMKEFFVPNGRKEANSLRWEDSAKEVKKTYDLATSTN